MRRVLHANQDFGTTTETFIRDRMLELDRLGWEAWVATRTVQNRDSCPFPPDERLFVTGSPGLPRKAWDKLTKPVARRAILAWLERPVRIVRPALIHAHFGWVAVNAIHVAQHHGVPLLPSFHGYDLTVFPRVGGRRGRSPYERLFASAPHALAVSSFLEGRLRELGYDGEVTVVPSGTRLDVFRFRGPRAVDGGEPLRLLYVGRIIPYKGVDDLVRAFAAVRRELPGATLEVIGDGSEREACEALARSLGLGADAVRFRGALQRDAVVRAYEAADLLVMPSRTDDDGRAEGLGNVTKEAFAVGLEVVATDHGGIPETFPPDRRAELVPERDPAALTEAILRAAAARDAWPGRASAARAWIEEAFDWRRVAPRIAAVYEQIAR